MLYHLARADFLERVRGRSFLLVLAATVYLGFAINRGDFYLELDGYQGVLNSAWVGGMMAASATLLLSLFGFYLVKNSLERDIRTGVGQIIAATPVSRALYLLGKWLSNWAVLSALLGILALAAVVMQWLGGQSTHVDPFRLLSPFLFLALPAMAVVAALALWFEAVPWLRGGLGNVLYFFVWTFALVATLEANSFWPDWSGLGIVWKSMGAALQAVYPAYSGGFDFTGQALPEGGLRTFLWSGVAWTPALLASRALWLAGALGLALSGGLFFRGFDATQKDATAQRGPARAAKVEDAMEAAPEAVSTPARLGALPGAARRSSLLRLLVAELRLLLKGQRWWWYTGAVVFVVGGLVSPLEAARRAWLPVAWLWGVLVWSALGTREGQHHTNEFVFSAPRPLSRQLPAAWASGWVVALLLGSGVALNALLAGNWAALSALMAGAVFIPALALSLGVWSGTDRLFEVVYVLLWYLGPLHPLDMPRLDFMGASDAALTAGSPLTFLLAALALMGLALLGRWRQLRS